MTSQRKAQMILLPSKVYGFVALLVVIATSRHYPPSVFARFALWSCIAAGFLVMIGAAIQAHYGFRKVAFLHAALGIAFIYLAAVFAPALAR